ncbi:MAG: NADH kinase, partial [Alistipes sp.]|nr:NADH kinase [Alistipes sp.]
MNIVLYGRPQRAHTAQDLTTLLEALDENQMCYRINREFAALITERTGRSFEQAQLYETAQDLTEEFRV